MPKGVYERKYHEVQCWKCGDTFKTVVKDPCYCPSCTDKGFTWTKAEARHEVMCETCNKPFSMARKPRSGHVLCPTCKNTQAKAKYRRWKRIKLLAGWKVYEYTREELEGWYDIITCG